MRLICVVASAVIGAAIPAPASADVTFRSKLVQEENGGRVTDVTEYRKGLKIRTDSSGPGMMNVSMIMDAGTGRTVMIWHDSKTATEHNVPPAPESVPPVRHSITPTSQTREIAGWRCTVYQVRTSSPMGRIEVSEPATLFMEGSTCLVKDGPGQADYVRIHRATAERARAANPMLMNIEAAELGVPFASEMTLSVGADTPKAPRHKIASHTMEVTSVSTAPIPDSIFEIPAGSTVTRR